MRAARKVAIATLIFVALSGLVGGIPLTIHANDEPWWMPQGLLPYSPFHSFLIPGIIPFSAIGLLSCWVLWLTLQRQPGYGWWVALEGCVLLGWLTVGSSDAQNRDVAQVFYAVIARVLIVSGMLLVRKPGGATR